MYVPATGNLPMRRVTYLQFGYADQALQKIGCRLGDKKVSGKWFGFISEQVFDQPADEKRIKILQNGRWTTRHARFFAMSVGPYGIGGDGRTLRV